MTLKKHPSATDVDLYLSELEHPLKQEILYVRDIIKEANPELEEHIKWNAPSFRYKNEDRLTFNLHGKGYFRLIFHCGPKVHVQKLPEPLILDRYGILEWMENDRAILKFTSLEDVKEKEAALQELSSEWIRTIRP